MRHLPAKRRMYAGHWGERPVGVKIFEGRSAKRHWEREKQGIELLRQRNILTPELLFAGALPDTNYILITAFIPDAITAQEQWQQSETEQERLVLLRDLTSAIAHMHQQGVWQKDLHLGNFLLSKRDIFTIDGDAICARSAAELLPSRIRQTNLTLFLAQIPPLYEHLFKNLLELYCAETGDNLHEWGSLLTNKVPARRKKRRLIYVTKAFRTCSEFTRHRTNSQLTIHRTDAPASLIQQLLEAPNTLLAQGETLKAGNSATVVRLQNSEGDWVIKRYNIKGFWHGLKRCLRPTRAAVSWGNAHRLKISEINTPHAIAMAEKRFGPFRLTGYYVCAHVAAPDVGKYFNTNSPIEVDKQQAIDTITQMFHLLYRLGIRHGDCKANNFLLKDGVPWVIDLDVMREFRCRHNFLRHYKADRARFLRNWEPSSTIHRQFDTKLP
ncbi:MAG: lipopolysaccharide kinase InaA family protein [Desulfuromonadaceae bacterium]|nr:lipopolysaccharide kinase InaA family protein [Desulfuromonadaceae bacterium]